MAASVSLLDREDTLVQELHGRTLRVSPPPEEIRQPQKDSRQNWRHPEHGMMY
jgi:hypothetical protein